MSLTFKNSVPEEVRRNPSVSSLLTVLDGLDSYKKRLIHKAHTVYNPVLLTNLDFLTKKVNELGYPTVPFGFPKFLLDNMYLYAEDVMSLMGSKIGLKLLIWVLTGGTSEIDDSKFYPTEDYIVLGDKDLGVLPASEDYPDDFLYLFSGVDNLSGAELHIVIYTPYYDNDLIKNYLTENITRFVGFTDTHTEITIEFVQGDFLGFDHVYQYFVLRPEVALFRLSDGEDEISDGEDSDIYISKF